MLKLEIPHSLSVDEAKKRVEVLLAYWLRKYSVKSTWAGDKVTFGGKVMGITIDAHLTVLPAKISGESSDPGMLLRGQAQKYLARKFGDYLDPRKSLADVSNEQ